MGVGVDYGVGVYWVTFEDLHALLFKIEWPFMQNRGNKLLTELSEWFNRSSLNKSVICIFCKCIQYMYDMYIMGHLYWTEHFIEEIFNLVLNIAGLWVQLGIQVSKIQCMVCCTWHVHGVNGLWKKSLSGLFRNATMNGLVSAWHGV